MCVVESEKAYIKRRMSWCKKYGQKEHMRQSQSKSDEGYVMITLGWNSVV